MPLASPLASFAAIDALHAHLPTEEPLDPHPKPPPPLPDGDVPPPPPLGDPPSDAPPERARYSSAAYASKPTPRHRHARAAFAQQFAARAREQQHDLVGIGGFGDVPVEARRDGLFAIFFLSPAR